MIDERAIVVELPDGRRFYSPHVLIDQDGGVLEIEPLRPTK